MAEKRDVWVFCEKPALRAELIAGARSLAADTGGAVIAVILGPRTEAGQAIALGAERAIRIPEPPAGTPVEAAVPTLAKIAAERRPYALLIGATVRGKAIAGRLAARLGVTALTDVQQFAFEAGALRIRHLIFGGGAVREEEPLAAPVLATVGPGTFAASPAESGRAGEVDEVAWVEPEWRVTVRERRPRGAANVHLAEAKKVVCAGRGIANQADLMMMDELARALGAELACSRPLAEGLGWLPRERYIGVSGATVRPDLYLGVGVSGQVQHAVGMSDSRVVVAINKDANAPIFAQSDYAIAGDLYAVVPALVEAIKARKK